MEVEGVSSYGAVSRGRKSFSLLWLPQRVLVNVMELKGGAVYLLHVVMFSYMYLTDSHGRAFCTPGLLELFSQMPSAVWSSPSRIPACLFRYVLALETHWLFCSLLPFCLGDYVLLTPPLLMSHLLAL